MALAQFEITVSRFEVWVALSNSLDLKVNAANAALVHVECLGAMRPVVNLELAAFG